MKIKLKKRKLKWKQKKAITPEVEQIDVAQVRKATAMKEEKTRIREINAISGKFNMTDAMREEAVESGISVSEFRELVMDAIERKGNDAPVDTSIGMTKIMK